MEVVCDDWTAFDKAVNSGLQSGDEDPGLGLKTLNFAALHGAKVGRFF